LIDTVPWFDYFHELLLKSNQPNIYESNWDFRVNTDEENLYLNSEISSGEVIESINKLKYGKSQGSDGIGAEFYKNNSSLIAPVLCKLFNRIFSNGVFLDIWRDCLIVPVHKSGPQDDPSNYRGISLINVMYKIFSNIIYDRLYILAEKFDKIDESQAGFRAGYFTIDNIFILQSTVQKYISKSGGRFYIHYVDFKKAFDGLKHFNLFNNRCGVRGNLFRVLFMSFVSCSYTQNCVDVYKLVLPKLQNILNVT
jgi:hypothetical protein